MVLSFVHRHGADARRYSIAARASLRIDLGENPLNSARTIGATLATRAGAVVLMLLLSAGIAVADHGSTAISVSPTTDCVISGQEGGTFAPIKCEYVITANRRWANIKVSGIPPWLVPSTTFGRTPLTVTLALDQTYAARQADGNYSAKITFSNVTSTAGTVTHKALLTVTGLSSPPPAPSPTPTPTPSPSPSPTPTPTQSGVLLDGSGFVLLDRSGGRLAAQ
jgi:hypothetical protein